MSTKHLQERTTVREVFQDMDNFDLLNDSSTFALSLRLQFPKFSKGFTSSDFETFVKTHVKEENLVSLGRLSFPNEWQMQVRSREVRENLIRMGKTKINSRTCWISPLSQSEVRGHIHWLPSGIQVKKLEGVLRPFGEVLFIEQQTQKKFFSNVGSDTRYFALYLKSGKTMDDVPHFINIGNYHGLITIRGRNPACFHCKEVGHRKSECKTYRERLSDYSNRPAGSAQPRVKPRGKRFNPRKNQQQNIVAAAIEQGVAAGSQNIEQVYLHVLEQLIQLVEANRKKPGEAETGRKEQESSLVAHTEEVATDDRNKKEASAEASQTEEGASQVEPPPKKTKHQIAYEQLMAHVEAVKQGEKPFMDMAVFAEERLAKKKPQEQGAAEVNAGTVPQVDEGKQPPEPKNFGDILWQAIELLSLKDEKPADGKKKKKRKKKKKKTVAEVQVGPPTETVDCPVEV